MKQASFMRRGWRMSYPVRALLDRELSLRTPPRKKEDPPDGEEVIPERKRIESVTT
jgi:hypothetical protein